MLIISREKSHWGDILRKYNIMVDGQRVAQIENGGTVQIDIPPGRHKLWVAIDWCRSLKLDIDISDDEDQTFQCALNAPSFLAIIYVTFLYASNLKLKRI